MSARKLLVTDFDGTMARHDFYTCVVEQLLTPDDLSPWDDYAAGRISHFESLRRIFAQLRAPESRVERVMDDMEFDVAAADSIAKLRRADWETVVVSNGCGWYIERLFARHGVEVPLHTNPGEYSESAGLQMRLPISSPYFSAEVGVSKTRVVEEALQAGALVAFAGDGRPDLEPALMVPAHRRFARGWLAETLTQRDESYVAFDVWSEIATHLLRSN